jgi:hypothetical protein
MIDTPVPDAGLAANGLAAQPATARLTVVVTVVEGGATLLRCLRALAGQVDAPAMEVLVPFDDSVAEVEGLARHFPAFRFLRLGVIAQPSPVSDAYAQHVLYECRRAAGLSLAEGDFVALLEDRGWPRPDWARAMVELHERLPHAAVGGAIEDGAQGMLRRAVYFCDFGRYEPPLQEGDALHLSDVNICYKRAALEGVRGVWEERYQEAAVNSGLQRGGFKLYLSARPRVVEQRAPIPWRAALAERIHWGRTSGHVLGRDMAPLFCLVRVASAPLVSVVLLVRHLRKQRQVRRNPFVVLGALPVTLVLMMCWSIGESIGMLEAARWTPRLASRKAA